MESCDVFGSESLFLSTCSFLLGHTGLGFWVPRSSVTSELERTFIPCVPCLSATVRAWVTLHSKSQPGKTYDILLKVWNPKPKIFSLLFSCSLDRNRSINVSLLVWTSYSARLWFDGFHVSRYPFMLKWELQSGSVCERWLTLCL